MTTSTRSPIEELKIAGVDLTKPETVSNALKVFQESLDELAQLMNVFVGDMSFVGPRPEVPRYVEMYTPYQRQVLLVRPGITDYASIAYRNENDLLAEADDPEKCYIEEIMPAKIEWNMKYLHEISPLADIRLIFKTIAAVVRG